MIGKDACVLQDPMITYEEICKRLGCTEEESFQIIHLINRELSALKKITVYRAVPTIYFDSFLRSEEYANLQKKWAKEISG